MTAFGASTSFERVRATNRLPSDLATFAHLLASPSFATPAGESHDDPTIR
jgi:hypothetical protein